MTRIPRGRLRLGQVWLDVDIDLGLSAEGRFEILFHMGGDVVSFDNRRTGIDLDVHVDNERVAVFAGALFCKIIGHYLLCVLGGCSGRCGGAFSFAFAALMHPNRTPQNPYGKFEEA